MWNSECLSVLLSFRVRVSVVQVWAFKVGQGDDEGVTRRRKWNSIIHISYSGCCLILPIGSAPRVSPVVLKTQPRIARIGLEGRVCKPLVLALCLHCARYVFQFSLGVTVRPAGAIIVDLTSDGHRSITFLNFSSMHAAYRRKCHSFLFHLFFFSFCRRACRRRYTTVHCVSTRALQSGETEWCGSNDTGSVR